VRASEPDDARTVRARGWLRRPLDASRCGKAGRLGGRAQLDANSHFGNPLTGVAPSFTSEAVAVLADDRDVRLAVQAEGFTAKRLHKERAGREMNDSRSFGVSSVELHAGQHPERGGRHKGPGAVRK
jgi:hypothetical protein